MVLAAGSFVALELLPVNFAYPTFAVLLLFNGVGMGLFASPNRAAIMNSLPRDQRGAGAGMSTTFQNSAMVLSIGIFFSLMIIGLSSGLPGALQAGLAAHGVPAVTAARVSHLPPVATLFSAFLGDNPVRSLLGPKVLAGLPHAQVATLVGRGFFPRLITGPFSDSLSVAFTFAAAACIVAAFASLLRGGKYHHSDVATSSEAPVSELEPGAVAEQA
jgi:hypothetical protein